VTGGALRCTRTGAVTVCEIVCAATATPSSGQAPLDVAFDSTVTVTGCTDPVGYLWDFGDGATSSLADAVHTYTAGGTYNWTLTVTSGAEVCIQAGTIEVCEIVCQASADPTTGLSPQKVVFSSTVTTINCTGPITYLWQFGDGSSSTAANPEHTYLGGDWSWVLTVTISGYQCQATGTVHVQKYNVHYLDDQGRSRLCLNTKSGEFEWQVLKGMGLGVYHGVCQIAVQSGLVNYTTARGLPYDLRLRYDPGSGRANGVFKLTGTTWSSGLDDRNVHNNPPGCD